MFNFTTETILNDLSKVKVLVGALVAPASAVAWDPGIEAGKKALYVERVNKFVVGGADTIKNNRVYRRLATPAILASSQIVIPTVVVGTLYRVGVTITTNGYADGQFARDRTTYGKPFYIELVATAVTAATAAAAIAAAWNKTYATYENFMIASVPAGANLVFTSVGNPFITIKDIVFESIDILTGTPTTIVAPVTVITAGVESFGDFTNLIKNHRLPTLDNNRPFGENQEELPVMGATYNQYTFEYVAERGVMAQSVVGGLATSKTTHVFFVNNAAARVSRHITGATAPVVANYSFEELLKAAGLTIIDIPAGDVTAGVAVPVEA